MGGGEGRDGKEKGIKRGERQERKGRMGVEVRVRIKSEIKGSITRKKERKERGRMTKELQWKCDTLNALKQ